MRRIVTVLAVAAAVAFAAPADAKPYTYSDPKDMPAHAGLDIVGVTYSTEGLTTVRTVRGKRVKTYEPTKLLVTMTLAGAPFEQPLVMYRAESQVDGCGALVFRYSPGNGNGVLAPARMSLGCGGPAGTTGGNTLFLDPKLTVKGSKLIWSVPLKSLPKNARAGALMFGFKSSVDVTDPALGLLSPDDVGEAVLDKASGDGDWEIG